MATKKRLFLIACLPLTIAVTLNKQYRRSGVTANEFPLACLEVVQYPSISEGVQPSPERWDVNRSPEPNDGGEMHEVWYDLYLDGMLSSLTATFGFVRVPQGMALQLYDICVR